MSAAIWLAVGLRKSRREMEHAKEGLLEAIQLLKRIAERQGD
jgi:hypothetical protein